MSDFSYLWMTVNHETQRIETELKGDSDLVRVTIEFLVDELNDLYRDYQGFPIRLGDGGFIMGQHRCYPVFPIDQEQYEQGALVFRVEEWNGWKSDIAALHQQK